MTEADPARGRWLSPDEIQGAVADHAGQMDGDARLNRLLMGRYRRRLFGDAEGRVLDVACGTAANLRAMPETVEYVGVDLSPEMLATAESRHGRLERGDSLHEMDAQDLAFADDSFDTVVTSLSTCMFPDPQAALAEMDRVCRPDGRVLLLEHGRSDVGPVARVQEWRADSRYEKMGCRWDQEPLAMVEESVLSVEDASTGLLGMVTAIEARPTGND